MGFRGLEGSGVSGFSGFRLVTRLSRFRGLGFRIRGGGRGVAWTGFCRRGPTAVVFVQPLHLNNGLSTLKNRNLIMAQPLTLNHNLARQTKEDRERHCKPNSPLCRGMHAASRPQSTTGLQT